MVLAPPLSWSQVDGHVPPQITGTSKSEVIKDALGRTTPRGTVLGFLKAASDKDYGLASQYLNTRSHDEAAAHLAQELLLVLDRRLPPKLTQISDSPEGSSSDPRKNNKELVGTIDASTGEVGIYLERVNRGDGELVWLFSRATVESIPELYDQINAIPVETVLPTFLIETHVGGIALFQWLAVFVGIPLFYLLTILLDRLLALLVGLVRRYILHERVANKTVLTPPLRLLLLAVTIHWAVSEVSLSLLSRLFWSSLAAAVTILACEWILFVLNSRAEQQIRRRLEIRNLTAATSILRLARRTVDVVIFLAGIFVALHHWGIKATPALAGLGISGIAIALAAQKTLENVIGGVFLIFDKVIRIGDVLRVGDTLGIVESIGLRSIRIRTLERTLVSIPNSQISNMSLETLSMRDKYWFHPILTLQYGTTSAQLGNVLSQIRTLLSHNTIIEGASLRVRLLRFGSSSLEIEVFAYVLARDWNHFLEVQEALLLLIMQTLEAAGMQIALPSRTVFLAGSANSPEPNWRHTLEMESRKTHKDTAA